jgi:hypothetical protein
MRLKLCLALSPILVYALYRAISTFREIKRRKDGL